MTSWSVSACCQACSNCCWVYFLLFQLIGLVMVFSWVGFCLIVACCFVWCVFI